MKIGDVSKDVTAYILVEETGRIPVLRGEIDVYWTRTAADSGADDRKKDGHNLMVERITIVRSGKRTLPRS